MIAGLLPAVFALGAITPGLGVPRPSGAIAPNTNPFANAQWYVDPSWSTDVLSSVSTLDPSLVPSAFVAANTPTAIWVAPSDSLKDLRKTLLNASKSAKKGDTPALVHLIVYDMPDRDCSASASSGEWSIAEGGASKYQSWIDEIAKEVQKYDDLRIVVLLEPDALPNMVTNAGDPSSKCGKAKPVHLQLLKYAITQLQFPT
ncbi:hypothetical protein HDV00_005000 [Rhizophlyctis rosea]|nr:hypothetical protein HDV00_005000 [Rhizophlyctis rosea]